MGLRDWTRAANVEPVVRVGIVLDEDACECVRLRVPGREHRVEGVGCEVEADTPIEVWRAGSGLTIRVGDSPPWGAATLRVSSDVAATPGAGVLVHDVVAGRGFHWQKRIDQRLAGTVELVAGERGVVLVNELPMEDYLTGVITAEMGSECPADLLKAQCVVARSWLLAMSEPKHDDAPFERCNDDCCQRYQGTGDLNARAVDAVRATVGRVLINPDGGVLDANYAKSCGGISELPRHVWGADKSGLSAVVDGPLDEPARRFFPVTEENLEEFLDGDWVRGTRCYCSTNAVPVDAIGRYLGRVDEVDDYFRWTVRYERAELEALLREKVEQARGMKALRDLRVVSRGVSGRASAVELEWEDADGQAGRATLGSEYRIREALHRKFLYSSAFAVRMERDVDGLIGTVTLRGAGWGHGVGLCQIGALGMALAGIDYESICRHYYPEAELVSVYE